MPCRSCAEHVLALSLLNGLISGAETTARWEQLPNVSCRQVIIGWERFEEIIGIVEEAEILTTVFYSSSFALVSVNLITFLNLNGH